MFYKKRFMTCNYVKISKFLQITNKIISSGFSVLVGLCYKWILNSWLKLIERKSILA